MDPTVIANAPQPLPLETSVKLAHHASEHEHEQEKLDPKKDGHVNPLLHAMRHSWKAAAWGSVVLIAFTAVLKSGMVISEAVLGGMGTVSAAAGIALAGAVWYGAQSFLKAFQNAQDHNHGIVTGLEEKVREHEQAHAKGRGHHDLGIDRERAKAETPKRVIGTHIFPNPPAFKQEEAAPVAMAASEKAERPDFLTKILNDGARSLNPKELAARVHEERSGAQQQGL